MTDGTSSFFAKAVEQGIQAVFTDELNGTVVKFRPLTDWELDEVDLAIISRIRNRKVQLAYLGDEKAVDKLEHSEFDQLQKARKEKPYLILIRSMMDFYDDMDLNAVTLDRVKKLRGVKGLLRTVMEVSGILKESKAQANTFREQQPSDKPKTPNVDKQV